MIGGKVMITVGVTVMITAGIPEGETVGLGTRVAIGGDRLAVAVEEDGVAVGDGVVLAEDEDFACAGAAGTHHTLRR